MQWLDYVFKFLSKIFKADAFKSKYKTKSEKSFLKYLHSHKWQVIDIRNEVEYQENHINGTINLSTLFFKNTYYKKLDKSKKILLINNNFRSHLGIYNALRKKGFQTYILRKNYYELIENPQIENNVSVVVY